MDTEVIDMTSPRVDLERRIEENLPARIRRPIDRLDNAVAGFMEQYGVTLLRIALAVVFIWFGTLKVIGRSPVEDLVKDTIYFLPEDTFFIVIGVWEIVIGIGLLIPVALRFTLLLFWLQMAGTFLSLIILPGRAFQDGNPLLLAVTGEFIIKNLVLIAAGLVIGSTVRRRGQQNPDPGSP
jgi:putative oxidoreductase